MTDAAGTSGTGGEGGEGGAAARRVPLLVRYGNFLFHYREALFPVVEFALLLGLRPIYPNGSERQDDILDTIGILIALAGQALRAAVVGYAYIVRGGKNRRVYAEGLITAGFFAHSRNPLYLGNLLILLGLFVVSNNPWGYVIGLTFFLVGYRAIVAAEEAYLRDKFGPAYDEYARDVPRWFPRLRGLRETLAGKRYKWRRVILKEYGSAFAWTAGAVALLAREALTYHSYQEAAPYLRRLAVELLLLTAAWLTVMWAKKTRRLTE